MAKLTMNSLYGRYGIKIQELCEVAIRNNR